MADGTPAKPPLPEQHGEPFPRIPVDERDDGAFAIILQIATFAADLWTLGPDGPYKQRMTPAQVARGEIREALLHLLELGVLDVDEARLDALCAGAFPPGRESARG